MSTEPIVSAVIPTFCRPKLVIGAVESALAQTVRDIEVVVVVDGGGRETVDALRCIDDPRVRTITAPVRLSRGGARNRGVAEARGSWIAFLDDDDRWEPEKLAHQLVAAGQSRFTYPIVSCRMRARCRAGQFIWPRRRPKPGEPIGDYLFRRKSLLGGEAFLQSSTLLAPRKLLLRVPFRTDPSPEDLDWVLRAARFDGAGVEFTACPDPLVIWDIEDDRPRASTDDHWRCSLDWIRANRDLVSARAYASFLLTWVSLHAARQGNWSDFLLLWKEARHGGKPSPLDIMVHIAHWIVPRGSSRRLSALASARYEDPNW